MFDDDTSLMCNFENIDNIPQKNEKIIRINRQLTDRESTHFKCR